MSTVTRARFVFVAVASVLAGACSSEPAPSPSPEPELLAPPPTGEGIQLRMVTHIEASSEVEHCQFFRAPKEGLQITRTDTRFTKGSHHVLLYQTPYKDIPTMNDRGEAVDTSGVFDCSEGATNGWSVSTLVGGSQNPDGDGPVEFPNGLAMTVPGDAILMMNAHYVNPSPVALDPEIRMNLYSIPDAEVTGQGALLFWYDVFIHVEPESSSRTSMSCLIPEDITFFTATSHMHKRGVGYEAIAFYPDGTSETLFSTDSWQGVPVAHWPEGHKIPAGTRIQYSCDYENAEAREVWQGPRSSDEMCMFTGAYYPARPAISLCASDPEDPYESLGLAADWIGTGSATCTETLQCLAAIGNSPTPFHDVTSCVLGAAPAESHRVSEAARCILTHGDPIVDCADQISACTEGSP